MSKNKNVVIVIVLLSFLCQGFSYSELFMSKEKRAYRHKMKETILQDWNQRSKYEHSVQTETDRLMPEPESLQKSTCKSRDFEKYQLAKGYVGTAVDDVTAHYCPAEQRYWISELLGDMVLKGRWYGPFEIKENNHE